MKYVNLWVHLSAGQTCLHDAFRNSSESMGTLTKRRMESSDYEDENEVVGGSEAAWTVLMGRGLMSRF